MSNTADPATSTVTDGERLVARLRQFTDWPTREEAERLGVELVTDDRTPQRGYSCANGDVVYPTLDGWHCANGARTGTTIRSGTTQRTHNAHISPEARISYRATIHPTARVEPGAVIAPNAVVGPHAHVGRGAHVGRHAYVAAGAYIGAGCIIRPGAHLADVVAEHLPEHVGLELEVGGERVAHQLEPVRGEPVDLSHDHLPVVGPRLSRRGAPEA